MTQDHRPLSNGTEELVRRVRGATSAAEAVEALLSVSPLELNSFLHPSFGQRHGDPITVALGASPGAASGAIVLTADEAIEAADGGRPVILVRNETTPDDVLGMQSARAVLTARGGIASHAAVVARGWGIPAVVGAAELQLVPGGVAVAGTFLPAGTVISLDGRTGEVFLGHREIETYEAPPELETLLEWSDRIRAAADPPLSVRVNADTAAEAAHGRHLGAQGIGLCRTEHMFLAADRLPLVRAAILATDPDEERAILHELEGVQREDFRSIFEAMGGLPVTVRLLDPPLHEFLPDLEPLVVAEALGQLDERGRLELQAVRRLREVNPMIGTRGVRLGVVKPGLYEMQVRAMCRAVLDLIDSGQAPQVEIMIPLVVDATEVALCRRWIAAAADEAARTSARTAVDFSVGVMIETPRAAMLGHHLADLVDFFSFGTNDLTQLTFGFSRDDVGSSLIPRYLSEQLLEADPFQSLDRDGVGRLIELACESAGRASTPTKLGACGEHAGDPRSIDFLVNAGVDYISCSPYRVPVARLAAAQTLLRAGRVSADVLRSLVDGRPEPVPETDSSRPPGTSVDDAHRDSEFLVLHAARIKGFVSLEVAAAIAALDIDRTRAELLELERRGCVRHHAARALWQIVPEGKDRHATLLAAQDVGVAEGLRQHYAGFLTANETFKRLCTSWQVRDGAPNSHDDPLYDGAQIERLGELHREVAPVFDGFCAASERFAQYRQRLTIALGRLRNGETRMFTGVMCNSYHDVWMELHEDLIQLMGIDRIAEGSH